MNRELLERYQIQPKRVRYKKRVQVIEDNQNKKFVVKPNHKKNRNIYQYLSSRNFQYFPRVYTGPDDAMELSEYIEDISIDRAQRIEDMIYLLSILHNKTTFYKELNLDEIKKIYEEMMDEYEYLISYYQSIQSMIEEEVYMSPSNYYFILNISKVYQILVYGRNCLDEWYREVSQRKTLRFVLNHNHLSLEHLLEHEQLYFISWDRAEFGFPTNDLVNLINENYEEIEISTLLSLYEARYKLMRHEYHLFLAKICLLRRLDFKYPEVKKVGEVAKFIQYLQKVYLFLSKQDSKKSNDYPKQ